MSGLRRFLAPALVLAGASFFATSAGASTLNATIAGSQYHPDPITVTAGDEIVWTNLDNTPHTVTARNGSFDSGSLGKNQTYRHTFGTPGTVPYFCTIHGFSGTIVVRAATTTTATVPATTIPPKPTTTTTKPKPTTTTAKPTTTTAAPTTTTVPRPTTTIDFTLTNETTSTVPVAAPSGGLAAGPGRDGGDSAAVPLLAGAAVIVAVIAAVVGWRLWRKREAFY